MRDGRVKGDEAKKVAAGRITKYMLLAERYAKRIRIPESDGCELVDISMDSGENQLTKAFAVSVIVLIVQLIGFHYSNSLALLGDSAHVLSDVLAVGASLLAFRLALHAPSARRTFGFHRVEVFAALFNGVLLAAMAILIGYEAMIRLETGSVAISGLPMLLTSIIGLVGNIYVAYHLQHDENLNIRSAFMHAAGDAVSSVGVIIGAVLIMVIGQPLIDVVISLLISVVILFSSYSITRGAVSILLESAPYGLKEGEIEAELLKINGVNAVHDLHVWHTCSDLVFALLHVEMNNMELIETRPLQREIEGRLRQRFGISHVTIQFEPSGCSCENQDRCSLLEHKKAGGAGKGHKHG